MLTLLCAVATWALINPNYTPKDLAANAELIQVLAVAAPAGNAPVVATVTATLKGVAPAQATLAIDLAGADTPVADAFREAMGGWKAVPAMLFRGTFATDGGDAEAASYMQVGVVWFKLVPDRAQWTVERDDRDLAAVWGGTARRLATAVRDTLADPLVGFAVKSTQTWGSDLPLGNIDGAVHGCLLVDGLLPGPPCLVVLAEGGDRVYQVGPRDGQPRDITALAKLATASQVAACGDFDGDGRLDLASWTGKALVVAYGKANDGFTLMATTVTLADCASLSALDTPAGAGLVAGTLAGPVLLAPDGKRGFTAAALPGPADDLGLGGICAVADFTGDGRADILQCFTQGVRLYAGEAPGRFAAPALTRVALPTSPSTLVCGDYDGDGRLDVLVGGATGCALLAKAADAQFANILGETGELEYHGAMGEPKVTAMSPCDINNDGRQGATLFYANRGAMSFFSRGYGCFGYARELGIQSTELPSAQAMLEGQITGAVLDLNGDGADDLFAVLNDGRVVALFGDAPGRADLGLTLALSPKAAGPLTVTVTQPGRMTGTYLVRPALPASVGIPRKGQVTAAWTINGKLQTRRITVVSRTMAIVEWTTPAGEAKRKVVNDRRLVLEDE